MELPTYDRTLDPPALESVEGPHEDCEREIERLQADVERLEANALFWMARHDVLKKALRGIAASLDGEALESLNLIEIQSRAYTAGVAAHDALNPPWPAPEADTAPGGA